jgi:putative transposase
MQKSRHILKAYKFRLKATREQAVQFSQIAGACRVVWNVCLQQRVDAYANLRKSLNSYSQIPEVTSLRKEYDWIGSVPSQVLQQKVRDLDTAYKNFFEHRADFPERKKKGKAADSFRFPQGFRIDNRRVFLPKIGWLGFFKSRDIAGTPRNVTVSRKGKHWFVSICCEVEQAAAERQSKSVGIDMGIAKLCAMSDGTIVENPKAFKRYRSKLAKLQRRLAKKKKFSANFRKIKARINALYTKIANARNDNIHKTTTKIAKNHGLVVIEDLRVKAMSKSAKGSKEKPGNYVRQKSGLNRSILDAGWGEFRRKLAYKLDWAGGFLVAVDPKNTSRRCSVCGHTAKENRLTQADFICVKCGHADDADVNAAVNILRAGHARLARGEIGAVRPLNEAGTLKAA